jgi:hypothetical protein
MFLIFWRRNGHFFLNYYILSAIIQERCIYIYIYIDKRITCRESVNKWLSWPYIRGDLLKTFLPPEKNYLFFGHISSVRYYEFYHYYLFYGLIWPSLWSSGQIPGYRFRDPEFDSRHYHISWEVVGLEWVSLSPVKINAELLKWKSSGFSQENRV